MRALLEPIFAPPTGSLGNVRGKYFAVAHMAPPETWEGGVLDVGCRGGTLLQVLEETRNPPQRYVGIDLVPPADVLADLGKGLPFQARSFETLVALDVLEHVDGFHAALAELARVARRFLVISLPNTAEVGLRWRFLRSGSLGGKFGLPVHPPTDRHRWVFTLSEARACLHKQAETLGFSIRREGGMVGPRRACFGRWLLERFPDLLVTTYVAVLERLSGPVSCGDHRSLG